MELDVGAVERELCRLPAVESASVATDDAGRPVGVQVRASGSKEAEAVARDVRSVAIASFGLDLDPRVISVAHPSHSPGPEENGRAEGSSPGQAILLKAVTSEQEGSRRVVRVALSGRTVEATGVASAQTSAGNRHRLAAQATLAALRQLEPRWASAELQDCSILLLGPAEVALATLSIALPTHEEVVSGSAVVGGGTDAHAVANAVLDAADRRQPGLR